MAFIRNLQRLLVNFEMELKLLGRLYLAGVIAPPKYVQKAQQTKFLTIFVKVLYYHGTYVILFWVYEKNSY